MDTIIKLFDDVKSMIWPIGVADVIDMLIMAFVIYKVILLIRRTSSGGVAKGILLLVAALWVSSFLRLYTVNFLLSKVVEWGVLALVILFQPGNPPLFGTGGAQQSGKVFAQREERNELDSAITQTVEAYTSLIPEQDRCVMVFERKNMLDDAIKTGTALDCTVNAELLKNIFWNKAPLHDGAVIVRSAVSLGRAVCSPCRAT